MFGNNADKKPTESKMNYEPDLLDETFLGKSLGDYYTYHIFVRDFGWITYSEATLICPGVLRLKEARFLTPPANSDICYSAFDTERGIEVSIADIILVVDQSS